MLRRRILAIPLLMLAVALTGSSERRPLVQRVAAIGVTVSDLDRSVAFFTEVLSFEKVREYEAAGEQFEQQKGLFGLRIRVAELKLGEERVELTEFLAPTGAAVPRDSKSNDTWFQHIAIVVSDMDRAYRHLRKHRVRHASSGPQRLPDWNPNAGGIEAFYFQDPDGHNLEVIHFPEGKGDAKWQELAKGGGLFLGIDHTAIVVRDTEASLRFYRDLLGMRVAGESENYGTEQEHLNNVFGARLRITSLRAMQGPGVEFLEYLAPRNGRPYPVASKASDLIHWQTRFDSGSVGDAALALRKSRTRQVSSGVTELPRDVAGYRKSLIVRDPDGHAVEIVEQ